jgi:hypothetical protein
VVVVVVVVGGTTQDGGINTIVPGSSTARPFAARSWEPLHVNPFSATIDEYPSPDSAITYSNCDTGVRSVEATTTPPTTRLANPTATNNARGRNVTASDQC